MIEYPLAVNVILNFEVVTVVEYAWLLSALFASMTAAQGPGDILAE